MLWLDGVFENIEQPQRKPRLHRARAPTFAQLTQLADTIANRLYRHLARQGWLEGEETNPPFCPTTRATFARIGFKST